MIEGNTYLQEEIGPVVFCSSTQTGRAGGTARCPRGRWTGWPRVRTRRQRRRGEGASICPVEPLAAASSGGGGVCQAEAVDAVQEEAAAAWRWRRRVPGGRGGGVHSRRRRDKNRSILVAVNYRSQRFFFSFIITIFWA
jgi:hypothetical protein